jgi:uncharacterized protein YchJ
MKPITGMVGCCARAPSGHVAAEPATALMKSRRRIAFPEAKDCAWLVQLQQGFATSGMGIRD